MVTQLHSRYQRTQLRHVVRLRWIIAERPDPMRTAMVRSGKLKVNPQGYARASEPIVGPLDRLGSVS